MDDLRLALFQHAPRLGDRQANIEKIAETARKTDADLFLTPELSCTGYDVRDNAPSLAVAMYYENEEPILKPLRDTKNTVVTGLITTDKQGRIFNSALTFTDGRPAIEYRKIYLPTYGMFDEARYFAPGDRLTTFGLKGMNGWWFGVLICEDFWHPGLVYALASKGIDVLLVLAAGAGRGVWEGGEASDFRSMDTWERMARATAQMYGIYVALANRVGVEGGVTFGGSSLIVDPSGEVLARGPSHEEVVLEVTLTKAELNRARRPYYHGRDDDPAIVIRELQQQQPQARGR